MNWLIVALDSNRDLAAAGALLSGRVIQGKAPFRFAREGIWITGDDLATPLVADTVGDPFTACYIFPAKIRSCRKPSFNLTTDRERPFTDAELEAARNEMIRLAAIGYAADGCGLQYIIASEDLYALVAKGTAFLAQV